MYQHRDYPEKSWSASRLESFYTCKRQYYFNTYGHWNGWENNAESRTKLIYRLKKLQNAYTLSGQLLHEQIKLALQSYNANSQNMLHNIRSQLNKAVKQSLNQRQKWEYKPNHFTMLHEYYYGNGVSKDFGSKITKRMQICADNFLKSDVWELHCKNKIKIIEAEEEGFPHFLFNNYKIYCILDMLYQHNDEWVIVDWKSGKPASEENRRQMAIYALYVLSKYQNVSLNSIRCVNEYLLTGEKQEYRFSSEDINSSRLLMEQSMAEMNDYLLDSGINKPLDEQSFPETTGNHCKNCNFIEVCAKGKGYLERE